MTSMLTASCLADCPPEWLPPIVPFRATDFEVYEDEIYTVFQKDWATLPTFRDRIVKLFKFPLEDGRWQTFRHMTSEKPRTFIPGARNQPKEPESRVPQPRRCERVGWARPMIECSSDTTKVHAWLQSRTGRPSWAIALLDYSYVIVLEGRDPDDRNRDGYFILKTSIYVEDKQRRDKFARDHEAYRNGLSQAGPRR